ncbi:MAG TPA: hypothetical protein VES67_16710 [Vicinamibacterales bacterium]|nr:hypothetical protein [Vicinamibacterales bacterium]
MVRKTKSRTQVVSVVAVVALAGAMQFSGAAAQQAPTGCRVTGRVTSVVTAPTGPFGGRGRGGAEATAPAVPATVALPVSGATILVHQGTRLVVATAADVDGRFSILFTPGQTFLVAAEMAAFQRQSKELTLGSLPCDTTLTIDLPLLPRDQPVASVAASTTVAPAGTPAAATPAATVGAATGRFTQLTVSSDPAGAATLDVTPPDQSAELARLLPPGFTLQGASADALSVTARGDAISVDRGVLGDRMSAIGRGEFDPATGQFAAGFSPLSPEEGFGQGGGRGGLNGEGGRGGAGAFGLGGRGGRGQSLFQGSANYSFGGSAVDATNYQPRNGVITPVTSQPYARNNYGGTIGGPVIIPGLYNNTNRRTSFQLNYSGNHSTSQQDQYTTVPTVAMRNGDFSGSGIQLVNPRTGQPFTNNQIPLDQMSAASRALLAYIPAPNIDGAASQNFHTAATTLSTSNSISLRINQNLTPNLPQRGAGPGGRGGGGGARGGGPGGGGQGGRGGRGLTINLSAQLQYRGNESEQFNVLPQLGGTTRGTSLTVPINLTVARGRTNNTFAVNIARNSSTTSNAFSNIVDVAGLAGISYPSTQDPVNWGVPNLSFSNLNVRSNAANSRKDQRTSVSYTLSRPVRTHQLRFGTEFRHDTSSTQSNGNSRGTFTFTGLYASNGALISRNTGADFADFLLGLPQQATLQVAGLTQLRQKAFAVYLEDNWQRNSRMTFNLGVRWEVPFPYVEASGHMANLDVTPDFTAAAVVTPGQVGPLSSITFPSSLIRTDWNNIGPRVGMAYRLARGTVLNTSYGITYNTTSYSSIAQRAVAQPPFADTLTNAGSMADPLSLETGLLEGTGVTNNFGIDPRYGLGMIQTWNATVSKTFWRIWTATAGYTGTRGTNLDLLRAPNRNPDGTLRIDGVQPFTWESSGGRSLLSLGSFSIQRGLARGLRFGASYTLARSMDNASSLGAGGAVVAQNDQDLEAEYALSNFDRRHQFSANATWELPFGVGRRWLADGGALAALVGEWSVTMNVSAESGSPFTPRVVGATTSVASGTSGSLRADYLGVPIGLDDETLLHFFNTDAFAAPAIGAFGTSPRNVIIGPGGYVVNAQFSRDMRIGGARSVGLTINANNLFNTTRWTAIDTNLNSNTFGQVTRFAPMRTITMAARIRF